MSAWGRVLTNGWSQPYPFDPAMDRERFETEEDYLKAYAQCAERLDFASLIKPGKTPALFHFEPVSASWVRKLRDVATDDTNRYWLVFRAALTRVDHAPELPAIERRTDADYPTLGPLVTRKAMDVLDVVSSEFQRPPFDVPTSLGIYVLNRSLGPSPKS